ncbi:DNA polymerase III subunit delta [Novipirellula artificiosorum]|uniref:DNA-directed DNA polymerase n=1 Tax=Novipirellula artificiosorum TaxID=2528016 RepID=A0A5C6E4C5_9BACT|nr:DNA polymerase III subunit delta [Novipirellula artificiosorum]TWU42069.1 DNA polymerase III subunit delta [Novipirellula artificiosorum]
MAIQTAFDLLSKPPAELPAVAAVYGSDTTLRSWVLAALSADGDVTSFDGDVVRWADLRDDLATASLFDFDGKRSIIVRDADKFVSNHRPELEKYVSKPGTSNRFLLDLSSLASNTRLYKAIAGDHLVVACTSTSDKKLGITATTRRKFLCGYVAKRHQAVLAADAADALVEMIGDEIGMLETEIAKLALYRGPGEVIDEPLVRDVVAGWQGKTVWQITDAIASGDAAEAMRQLDKLMSGGQRPIALLPQIAWSLRRLGMATAVVEHREREGRSVQLEDALAAAGINRPSEIQQAKKQLRGLGRARGKQLLPWLLDADLRLKGTHSAEGRDRFLLEQLVMRMAKSG